jgi:hypothetical protein
MAQPEHFSGNAANAGKYPFSLKFVLISITPDGQACLQYAQPLQSLENILILPFIFLSRAALPHAL